jgi:hypothetical protein
MVAIHPCAEEAPILIIALLAEDADTEAEHTRPRKMIERYAANQPSYDFSGLIGTERDFFFGSDDPWGPVNQVDHH